ncbi:MAG TPA: CoA transferase, partial [Anaerolineales bacterium]|nr:CoA transferase [Anaerolineales bacterium]
IMPLMGWVAANLLIGGQQPELLGNDNFTAAPSGMFKTKDGYINISANQQEQWENLADELGLSHLKTHPCFQERDVRKANRTLLTPLLETKLTQNTTAHWVEVLNAKGIPSGDVLRLDAALTSAQVRHREVIVDVEQPCIGDVKLFNLTAKFSKTPGRIETPPPMLSEHTREILTGLGYTAEEQKTLKQKMVT